MITSFEVLASLFELGHLHSQYLSPSSIKLVINNAISVHLSSNENKIYTQMIGSFLVHSRFSFFLHMCFSLIFNDFINSCLYRS